MSNLLYFLIAIAIGTIMTIVSMNYLGGSFTEGKVEAEAAKLRSESDQLAAALDMYRTYGNEVDDAFQLSHLVDEGYLKSMPDGWEPRSERAVKEIPLSQPGAEEVCLEALGHLNLSFDHTKPEVMQAVSDPTKGIPYCRVSGVDLDYNIPCCVSDPDIAAM